MKTYALKYKNDYYMFTQNIKDLHQYRNNKISSNVELKIIKTEKGNYWLFIDENGDIIIESLKMTFDGKIDGKIGEVFKIDLDEV